MGDGAVSPGHLQNDPLKTHFSDASSQVSCNLSVKVSHTWLQSMSACVPLIVTPATLMHLCSR